MKKTNVARILQKHKISFELLEYDVDEEDLSAETVAKKIGKPLSTVYKTLVLHGDKTGTLIAIVPGAGEVNLKLLAALSGNKKCHMVPMKEVLGLTGYIRGGVSPLGMKKSYPEFADESILNHERICVSAGVRGLQLFLRPEDLLKLCAAKPGKITETYS